MKRVLSIRDFSSSITSEKKIRNRIKRAVNGNIKNQIHLMLWNKGNSNIRNKIQEIRDIVEQDKPEILVINEFNHKKDEDLSNTIINGYQLELDQVPEGSNSHRNAIYIKNNILYKREQNTKLKNLQIFASK